MVAQHSSGQPPRSLSSAAELQLQRAFELFHAGDPDASAALMEAVRVIGLEASERGLTPEELLIAFKSIEARAAPPDARVRPERFALIRALLEAYYR